ncbi:MAG: enoyl-CoA hydratase/isomerase family protein [Thermoplasmata archaeon]|nr:enoyl-CoA hydratase/isomerase family protein [Thermoplasmata archaeon]
MRKNALSPGANDSKKSLGALGPAMPVKFDVEGKVARITIDRPEALNAIDPEVHRALVDAWQKFRDDPELHVAVVTGAGERAFSAGVDIKRMGELYGSHPPQMRREIWNREPGIGGITRNLDPGKPTIAAIRGHCLGGGLELALACDIRYASPEATFGLPEVKWGIIPGQGGTQRLARAVPKNVALEMILTARPIGAQRAFELGLVNRVFPANELLPAAMLAAKEIAEQPPKAVRTAREAVLRGLELPLAEGLRLEQDLADPLRDSEENRAARARFSPK